MLVEQKGKRVRVYGRTEVLEEVAAKFPGRLLSLQDDLKSAQMQGRMLTSWGDRATSKEAAQKLIATFVDCEVLRSTKTKGHFHLTKKITASIPEVQLWLLAALQLAFQSFFTCGLRLYPCPALADGY